MHIRFHHLRFFVALSLCAALATSGCGKSFQSVGKSLQNSKAGGADSGSGEGSGAGSGSGDTDGGDTDTGGGSGSGDNQSESLGICGPLLFDNVVWPSSLTFAGRRAFAVSLNITGSFEGNSGWSTIANNSDGQGVSLGLLQQNLGQGTLQPLLIKIRKSHPELLKQIFTEADRASLLAMLATWESSSSTASPTPSTPVSEEEALFPRVDVLSPLDKVPQVSIDPVDDDEFGSGHIFGMQSLEMQPMLTARNTASVAWAKKNLYSGTAFVPRWKTALQALAMTAAYRSLQIEQAESLFDKAESYFNALKFKEQRSFFLMYDFVVQNGGFTSSHKSQFDAYNKANPTASETARAKKLTEIRVSTVLSQYKNDVRSRKNTIIDGKGTVHGRVRDLPKENCYVPNEILTATTN